MVVNESEALTNIRQRQNLGLSVTKIMYCTATFMFQLNDGFRGMCLSRESRLFGERQQRIPCKTFPRNKLKLARDDVRAESVELNTFRVAAVGRLHSTAYDVTQQAAIHSLTSASFIYVAQPVFVTLFANIATASTGKRPSSSSSSFSFIKS